MALREGCKGDHRTRPADLTRATKTLHWFNIREAFTVDRTLINLNNASGVSPAPRTS